MRKSFYFTIGSLIMGLVLLAACGGGDNGSQPAAPEAAINPTPVEEAAAQVPAGDPARGEELFNQTCVACHGPGGVGVQGLGKDMTTSEFIESHSDQELVEFIKVGRDPSDPLNTTGVAMPPKGGNPALSDEDLQNIVAYMRTLQE